MPVETTKMKRNKQMKRRCLNCAHFLPDEIYAGEFGNCHCHAPTTSEMTGYGVWPRVLPTDFCGDHCMIILVKTKKENKQK